MYAAPLLLDAEAGDESSADELLLRDAHSDAPAQPLQPLRTLSQQQARPRPSVGGTHLTELLSQSYAERVERERKPLEPSSLFALRQLCPLLAKCLWFSGLAGDAAPTAVVLSRPVRAGGVLLLSLIPLVPGAVLPECGSVQHGSAAACVSRSTSWLYLLIDAAFTSFLLAAGPPLVATLSEVLEDASAVSKHEVKKFARRTTRLLLLLFALLWALLPLAGLLQAATHAAGVGDVVTRWLWLVAGPARAALMTAVTTSLVVTLRLHSLPLKAIRAAARLREQDALRTARQLVDYYAALLSAYAHSMSLLNSTSVRLQRLVAVLLLFGIQNLFAMLVFYYASAGAFQVPSSASIGSNSTAVPSATPSFAQDAARTYDVLEELVHCGAFVFMALAALGMAAHLTSLCDATGRALRAGLGHGLASVLAGAASLAAPEQAHAEEGSSSRGADAPRMPGEVANEAALLSALVSAAADSGGFRIVGSRVTFAWFSLMLTLSLGVANFGLSTAKKST